MKRVGARSPWPGSGCRAGTPPRCAAAPSSPPGRPPGCTCSSRASRALRKWEKPHNSKKKTNGKHLDVPPATEAKRRRARHARVCKHRAVLLPTSELRCIVVAPGERSSTGTLLTPCARASPSVLPSLFALPVEAKRTRGNQGGGCARADLLNIQRFSGRR